MDVSLDIMTTAFEDTQRARRVEAGVLYEKKARGCVRRLTAVEKFVTYNYLTEV